jgi:flagellar motor switch protein FliM
MAADHPVLSAEETQAIMDALREVGSPRAASVEKIDLVGGERPLRAALPVFEKLGAGLAAAFRRTLATTYRLSCEVQAESCEIVSSSELRRRLEPGVIVGRLEAMPSASPVMMLLGPVFVSAVVDCGFGGFGDEAAFMREREPTALERNLLRRLCSLLAADASTTWKRDTAIDLQFMHFESRNDLPSALPEGTALLLLQFRLTFGSRQDEVSVALTAGAVDVAARSAGRDTSPAPVSVDEQAKRRIKAWPVWLSSELGRCALTVDQLLALTPGSVLRLDSMAHEPVKVLINGVPKLMGQPVISKGSLATRIERWLEQEPERVPERGGVTEPGAGRGG